LGGIANDGGFDGAIRRGEEKIRRQGRALFELLEASGESRFGKPDTAHDAIRSVAAKLARGFANSAGGV
jgi:hypothetical protein